MKDLELIAEHLPQHSGSLSECSECGDTWQQMILCLFFILLRQLEAVQKRCILPAVLDLGARGHHSTGQPNDDAPFFFFFFLIVSSTISER